MSTKEFEMLNDDDLMNVTGGSGELLEAEPGEIITTPSYNVDIPADNEYKCKSCKQKINDSMLITIKRDGKKRQVCPFCKENPKKKK